MAGKMIDSSSDFLHAVAMYDAHGFCRCPWILPPPMDSAMPWQLSMHSAMRLPCTMIDFCDDQRW
jgi:hypothetical protein